MQILPISKQSKTTNPTFEAVNQKYLKRAIKQASTLRGVKGDLLDCLYYDVHFKQMSKQDGIDTLNAIRPYVTGAKEFFDHIYDVVTKINQ